MVVLFHVSFTVHFATDQGDVGLTGQTWAGKNTTDDKIDDSKRDVDENRDPRDHDDGQKAVKETFSGAKVNVERTDSRVAAMRQHAPLKSCSINCDHEIDDCTKSAADKVADHTPTIVVQRLVDIRNTAPEVKCCRKQP